MLLEMQYCGSRGIPHSTFLSWSEDDQDKALAWMISEAEKCHRCGSVTEEWMDPEGKVREDSPYETVVTYCAGCEALADREREIPEQRRNLYHVFLRRVRKGIDRQEG